MNCSLDLFLETPQRVRKRRGRSAPMKSERRWGIRSANEFSHSSSRPGRYIFRELRATTARSVAGCCTTTAAAPAAGDSVKSERAEKNKRKDNKKKTTKNQTESCSRFIRVDPELFSCFTTLFILYLSLATIFCWDDARRTFESLSVSVVVGRALTVSNSIPVAASAESLYPLSSDWTGWGRRSLCTRAWKYI